MSKRRKNHLQTMTEQPAVKLFDEAISSFEDCEKLFYANEKAKNRHLAPGEHSRL